MARTYRVCPHPGCPRLTRGGRCPDHARPTSTQRGYDAAHTRESRQWKQRIRNGEQVKCWRCGELILDADDMQLGHVNDERDTDERRAARWPEHGRRCNSSAAGRSSRDEL